jgi:hypothetical protein
MPSNAHTILNSVLAELALCTAVAMVGKDEEATYLSLRREFERQRASPGKLSERQNAALNHIGTESRVVDIHEAFWATRTRFREYLRIYGHHSSSQTGRVLDAG